MRRFQPRPTQETASWSPSPASRLKRSRSSIASIPPTPLAHRTTASAWCSVSCAETLIRIDCRGRAIPGLAASWRLEPDGRTWIVTLRDGARFSDGSDVTAADIRAAWARDASGEMRPQVSRLVQSIALAGDRAVAVTLHSRRADAPVALAHPDLAIGKAVDGSTWPLGTRASRIGADDRPAVAAARRSRSCATAFLPSVSRSRSADARDLLDQGADLLITRNPAVLGYASTFSQLQTLPLAWHRTHVLAVPGRPRSSPLALRRAAVRCWPAMRFEAKHAEREPFWWQSTADCAMPATPPRAQASPTPRIVYDAGDSAARELAERLVGLGRVSSPAATAVSRRAAAGSTQTHVSARHRS